MKVHSVVRKLHCASFEFLGQFVSFSVGLSLCCHIWSRRTKQNILQDKYFLIIFVLFILAVIMNSYCIWTLVKARRKHLSQMVKQGWLILQVGLLWTFIWTQVCSVYYHHAYIIEMWKVNFWGLCSVQFPLMWILVQVKQLPLLLSWCYVWFRWQIF